MRKVWMGATVKIVEEYECEHLTFAKPSKLA